jgi:hypothetical protein
LAFYHYRDNSAHAQFMPTQSYVDIMIMIKNVYYCVAKAKVDNPKGNFYPILLGTDCLETFFSLIRTAVGTDANVDLLQLGSRASGLTEVAAILAEHPKWDSGTCRLTLPQFTGDIYSQSHHRITPKDWRGDASVAWVNLHTCWLLGQRATVKLIPEAGLVFNQLLAEDSANIDILSPLGTLLVNQHNGGEDDFKELGPGYPEDPSLAVRPSEQAPEDTNGAQQVSYMHDGDLEDAMADEMP